MAGVRIFDVAAGSAGQLGVRTFLAGINADPDGGGMQSWARSPKFQLRMDAIACMLSGCAPGRFLEVGAGTGEFCESLLGRGFSGKIYDIGERTRETLRIRFADRDNVAVVDSIDAVEDSSMDYLFAIEVLEHIVDDAGALSAWTRKLKPGGLMLLSVPAHQSKFGPTDKRVGHVRRYGRQQLVDLADGCGCSAIRVASYGFPLGNLGRIAGNLLERRLDGRGDLSAEQRSVASGTEQSRYVIMISKLLNRWTLAPFFWMQRLAFATDLGDGYLLSARRRVARG